jgi:hypothetical protein
MKSIGCSQTRTSLAESDRVTDLVKGSQRLPGALGVTLGRQGVRVDFPESEFFIHTKDDPASAQCRVTFTAVVRAAPPSLSTWWCDWTRTCPKTRAAEMALEEIVAARSRFRRLVDEASDIELSARLCDPRGRTSTASSDAAPVRGVPPSGPPVDCGPVYLIGTPKGRTTRGWHPRTANSTFGVQP